jgi:hypothetical protein
MMGIAPQWTIERQSAKQSAAQRANAAKQGCPAINAAIAERYGHAVLEGPFAGTVISPMMMQDQIGPYLLGVYESELDSAWVRVLAGRYEQIIDIGAKFGYYAVGMARRYPDAEVHAFDTDPWARDVITEMAAVNATKNVHVGGFCTPAWMQANVKEHSFVFSDCEGYESVLFTPETVSTYRQSTLIIETHDCYVPGVTEQLRKVFAGTHELEIFGETSSHRASAVDLSFLSEPQRILATTEFRPPQIWYLLTPKPQ